MLPFHSLLKYLLFFPSICVKKQIFPCLHGETWLRSQHSSYLSLFPNRKLDKLHLFPYAEVLDCFNSSAAGDWVNCGICGEWAHFGCDRRQGLGAFKVSSSSYYISAIQTSIEVQTLWIRTRKSSFVHSNLRSLCYFYKVGKYGMRDDCLLES